MSCARGPGKRGVAPAVRREKFGEGRMRGGDRRLRGDAATREPHTATASKQAWCDAQEDPGAHFPARSKTLKTVIRVRGHHPLRRPRVVDSSWASSPGNTLSVIKKIRNIEEASSRMALRIDVVLRSDACSELGPETEREPGASSIDVPGIIASPSKRRAPASAPASGKFSSPPSQ